jgi:hypothetical protein
MAHVSLIVRETCVRIGSSDSGKWTASLIEWTVLCKALSLATHRKKGAPTVYQTFAQSSTHPGNWNCTSRDASQFRLDLVTHKGSKPAVSIAPDAHSSRMMVLKQGQRDKKQGRRYSYNRTGGAGASCRRNKRLASAIQDTSPTTRCLVLPAKTSLVPVTLASHIRPHTSGARQGRYDNDMRPPIVICVWRNGARDAHSGPTHL